MSDDASQLFDDHGHRKYVCEAELAAFLRAATAQPIETSALCRLLALTGCRISEALAITDAQLDGNTGRVVIRTLKRRRQSFRAVPVPADLMADLLRVAATRPVGGLVWTWCRQTAWRRIKGVMRAARIAGVQATPKGLRHGFGVANAERNIPTSLTQRWMGHARPETTAIYQHVVGGEERAFAERLWQRNEG